MYELNLPELKAAPNQPRKTLDETAMAELIASILKMGVIEPILFRTDGQGDKIVVAGERRVEAARQAGLSVIPGIYISGNHGEIALVENLLRQDLTYVETAEALQALMLEQQYTQEQLGAIIGKSQNSLSEILSLNRLPQEVRDKLRGDRTVAKTTLVAIAKKKKPEQMTAAYHTYNDKVAAVKLSGQKRDPNDPQKVFDLLVKTVTKLSSIDTSNWSENDKNTFQTSLTDLITEIGNHRKTSTPS
jgi:ParB family chromosome partitioning protein